MRAWTGVFASLLVAAVAGCAADGQPSKASNKPEPLRRVKVNAGSGDWTAKTGTPGADPFGNLPIDRPIVDTTQPVTSPSSPAEVTPAVAPVDIISRLTLYGLSSRGIESGDVFLPRRSLTPGKAQSHRMGDDSDGCEIIYTAGVIADGKVPVMVELRMWGRRQTKQKWVLRMNYDKGETFLAATRGGEQFRFDVALEGMPPEDVKSSLPTARDLYLQQREPPPPP